MTHTNNPTEQQAPIEWILQDLETTVGDASPEELPGLHAKLLALTDGLAKSFAQELHKRELKLVSQITTDKGDAYYQNIPLWRYKEQLEAQLKETPHETS